MPRDALPSVRPDDAAGARLPGLDSPLGVLRGVGPDRIQLFERMGVHTIGDLLLHAPRRYEDRRTFKTVRELSLGQSVTVRAKVVAAGVNRFRSGKTVFQMVLDDGTARLHCRWWNLPFLERVFSVGDDLLVFGKVHSLRPRTMDHPETEKVMADDEEQIHLNRLVPVYPATEGLTQRVLRGLTWQAVERFADLVPEMHPELKLVQLSVRPAVELGGRQLALEAHRLPPRSEAIRQVHFPGEPWMADLARQRLALDEFVTLQRTIQRRRRRLEANARALPCSGDNRWMRTFLARLGFPLTGAQQRVLKELRAELGGTVPMCRLLQGDVGSGKTLVAAGAALMTLESGFNVAVMAPTEILAEQLYRNFRRWFEGLGVVVELRTGSRKPDEPGGLLLEGARDPTKETPILTVGTHALIQPEFLPKKLGLVIIDEQHKFGVAQREELLRKGRYPHLLVMTATPIPRTLGLTLYGDLDVSVLDELPGGRKRIRTHVRPPSALPKVWSFVRTQLDAGRQAYLVYPRVDESEHDEVKAVTREHARIQEQLKPYRVGLLHGQMKSEAKDQVMTGFRSGFLHALVATSVVEVGVDVPNATVMVIENAEQFGLAQLHQLRGRIGRGGHEAHCILIAAEPTPEAEARLKVLVGTTDGFELAEADLRLRGPGELVGQQQSGAPDLRFGDLRWDRDLVELARDVVRRGFEAKELS
ncbi:MAG TPA: ATP-dependent DNA helicase RecG [Verrucomicrobiota bacterium]|nr:ATP-dependent DNA helicase RecG [Verrucomicrobiales bacterium]HRI13462.1 ATP-dependent DNA helicase RecG [Verrucomicrobiota bacterium]